MWMSGFALPDALRLAKTWGFEFKTIAFIWDKNTMGMGYWTRKQAEVCLLFTKGKPRRLSKGVRQIIRAPRREHSRKPDEIYGRIMSLVNGPYLEMFARQQWPGWDALGDETNKFRSRKQSRIKPPALHEEALSVSETGLRDRNTIGQSGRILGRFHRYGIQTYSRGALPCIRDGRVVRVRREDVLRYEESRCTYGNDPAMTSGKSVTKAGSDTLARALKTAQKPKSSLPVSSPNTPV